jgi:hypothetical protein
VNTPTDDPEEQECRDAYNAQDQTKYYNSFRTGWMAARYRRASMLNPQATTDMRKLIQLTSTAVSGMDGSTTTFVYGLCDDGTAWELYAGDAVAWSPLPAIPQDARPEESELRHQGWKEATGNPILNRESTGSPPRSY